MFLLTILSYIFPFIPSFDDFTFSSTVSNSVCNSSSNILNSYNYNLLIEKMKVWKFTVLEHSLLWKCTVTVNLKKFSSNTISRWYICGLFTWSNLIILVEDLVRWKRGFEMFLIEHYTGDIGNKNIAST